jgi:Na+-transporting methylmalonyl-CoA/oxaloacetate decarboxylase gamma subunit
MQAVDWGQAFSIVGGGLLAVFTIMILLAVITHLFGKLFSGRAAKAKAEGKSGEAKS